MLTTAVRPRHNVYEYTIIWPMSRYALLLIGHSSSGKSPLGELLQHHPLPDGGRLLHLDFGEHLRRTCERTIDPGFTDAQRSEIEPLMQGQLLTDKLFWVARTIIDWFTADRRFDCGRDVLVLNGIPRHTGQARELHRMGVEARLVVHLDCSARIAWQRKRASERGAGFEDRSRRTDSGFAVFSRKVASFDADTRPVLDWYRARGVPLARIDVCEATSPRQMCEQVVPLLRW